MSAASSSTPTATATRASELDGRPEGGAGVLLEVARRGRCALRGTVEQVTDAEADAYFATRPRMCADRRLGQQAVGAARKPARVREGGRALHGEIRRRRGAAAAALVGLPHRAADDRILAGAAVPPA